MRLALLAPCPVVRNNWRCALDPPRTWDLRIRNPKFAESYVTKGLAPLTKSTRALTPELRIALRIVVKI